MRKTIHAAAAAILAWSAGGVAASLAWSGGVTAAWAADLNVPPVYGDDSSQLVEFGSGWYLRADANVYDMSYKTDVFGSLNNTNFGATMGAGYQFNPMFRVDLTYDYMTVFTKTTSIPFSGTGSGASVPYSSINPLYPVQGCPVDNDTKKAGYVYTVGCSGNYWNKVSASAYLMNGYLDLGHWYNITPYVGVGAGLAYINTQANVTYTFSDGTPYGKNNDFCGGSTGLGGISCYHLGYWNNSGPRVTNYNFAYALMAGFSYDVSNLLKIDIGYRYLNLGPNISTQEFRAGVRITPDG
jgi:opacity protein-like surface antigen